MSVQDGRGHTILPRTRKSRAILAILAMGSPKPVLRGTLAELLWSRREKEQARASLRQCVHELQDTLGADWGHLFQAERHHLCLKGPELSADLPAIAQDPDMTVEALARFSDLLLADLDGLDPAFDRWLKEERARCNRIARTIGETLLARVDDPIDGVAVSKALLAIERTHQGAWRMLMRGHAANGDLGAALDCYDACRGAITSAGDLALSREIEDLAARLRDQLGSRADHGDAQPVNITALLEPAPRRDNAQLRLLVAPLRPIGEDRDGLAAGLSEEIATGLSKFRWISCLHGVAPGEINADPATQDVDMAVEGTVQQAGSRVRIIVKLVDRRTEGEIVWAGRFDRTMTDPLSLQDELGAAIVAQIDPELMRHEGKRPSRKDTSEATAQDLLLRALPGIYRLDKEGFPPRRPHSLPNGRSSSIPPTRGH
jgi:DNA-binding SARP family transcriptional activator